MENELKYDALNIGSKGQHDLRKTIIRMLKDSKKGNEIVKDLGVSVGHDSNVKKLYETGGAAALKPKKRGRPAGKNKNVQNRLDYLAATPSVIASFFQAPFTRYAA